jgi:tetratricopeptide (TPR) repeat protein
MTRRLATTALVLVATSLSAAEVAAQCAPPVQRQIADRRLEAAHADVQAQLQRAPNDDAAMDCLGRILIEQGQPGDAVQWLEKAIAINGKSAVHHLTLGNALRLETQNAGTLRQPFLARRMKAEYEQAVALDPTLVDARHWLVMFHANAPGMMGGSLATAREHAAAILKLDPMRGHLDYATIAEQEKDLATAEKELLAAVAAAPDNATPYEATGAFYRRQQRWTDAIAIYEKLLNAKPDAVNAHLSLGRIYVTSLKQYERGEKEVRLWLANQPKDASAINISNAHYCLGVVHQQGGRRNEARAEFQAALAANPKHDDAKNALSALRH